MLKKLYPVIILIFFTLISIFYVSGDLTEITSDLKSSPADNKIGELSGSTIKTTRTDISEQVCVPTNVSSTKCKTVCNEYYLNDSSDGLPQCIGGTKQVCYTENKTVEICEEVVYPQKMFMDDGTGVFRNFTDVVTFRYEGDMLVIEWYSNIVYLKPYVTIDGKELELATDWSKEVLKEPITKEDLQFKNTISDSISKYYFNHTMDTTLSSKLEPSTSVTSFGYSIVKSNVDCKFVTPKLYCGGLVIDFSDAVNKQNLTLSEVKEGEETTKIALTCEKDCKDLSYIDPSVSLDDDGYTPYEFVRVNNQYIQYAALGSFYGVGAQYIEGDYYLSNQLLPINTSILGDMSINSASLCIYVDTKYNAFTMGPDYYVIARTNITSQPSGIPSSTTNRSLFYSLVGERYNNLTQTTYTWQDTPSSENCTGYGYANLIDGDWSTSYYMDDGKHCEVSYTRPHDAFSAKWRVKELAGNTTVSIPNGCFWYSASRIWLQLDEPGGEIYWKCLSNTGYDTLRTGYEGYMYEEAINWTSIVPKGGQTGTELSNRINLSSIAPSTTTPTCFTLNNRGKSFINTTRGTFFSLVSGYSLANYTPLEAYANTSASSYGNTLFLGDSYYLSLSYNSTNITINSCSDLNIDNSYYSLGSDITNSGTSSCIDITASNLTFDCKGHIIDGDGSADYGLSISLSETAISKNVTIKNCTFRDWDTAAIYVYNASDIKINNISIKNSRDNGIYYSYMSSSILSNITFYNSSQSDIGLLYNYLSRPYCKNTYQRVTSNGRAVVYRNHTSTILQNWHNISQLIFCGANKVYLNNLSISGNSKSKGGGLLSAHVKNFSFYKSRINNVSSISLYRTHDIKMKDIRVFNLSRSVGSPFVLQNNYNATIHNLSIDRSIYQGISADSLFRYNFSKINITNTGSTGFYVYRVYNLTLYNSSISSATLNGITISDSIHLKIRNVTIKDTSSYNGIYLYGSSATLYPKKISFSWIRIENSSRDGINANRIRDINFTNITIIDDVREPINITTGANNVRITNCYFNATGTPIIVPSSSNLTLNTTERIGKRIKTRGISIGGNYYAFPNGTGYSETCTDADTDGFCDTSRNFSTNAIDYLPLSEQYVPLITVNIINKPIGADENITRTITYLNYTITHNETLWYKNNVLQSGLTNKSKVGSGNLTTGQTWRVSSRVFDGNLWSLWTNDSVVIGDNVNPQIQRLYASSSSLVLGNSLTLYANITDSGGFESDACIFTLKKSDYNSYLEFNLTSNTLTGTTVSRAQTTVPYGTGILEWTKVRCTDSSDNPISNNSVGINITISNTITTSSGGGGSRTTVQVKTIVNGTSFCGDNMCNDDENPISCWQDCQVNYDTLFACLYGDEENCNWEQSWFPVGLVVGLVVIGILSLFTYEVNRMNKRRKSA